VAQAAQDFDLAQRRAPLLVLHPRRVNGFHHVRLALRFDEHRHAEGALAEQLLHHEPSALERLDDGPRDAARGSSGLVGLRTPAGGGSRLLLRHRNSITI
jgi:hypothetical protein